MEGDAHTYADILRGADKLAAEVCGAGRPDLEEARVAFLCPPGPTYVASMLAAWAAGGVAVPLHPGHPDAELEYVMANAAPKVVVCHSDFYERVEPIAKGAGVDIIRMTPDDVDGRGGGSAIPSHMDSTWDPETWAGTKGAARRALMIYTSGTTGRPKGAVHTHRGVTAQMRALVEAWQYQPTDRIPHFLPLHHTHGIVNKLLCTLWAGGCVEFAPDAKAATLVSLLTQSVHRPPSEQFTLFMAVPTIYALMAKHLREMDDQGRAAAVEGMQQLRLMVSGSAACPVPLMEEWEATTGHRLLERYGMTEVGMAMSNSLTGVRHPGFVGLPLPGVTARLVEEVGGAPAKPVSGVSGGDVEGLLEIKGPNVFLEYWGNPEATAKEFTPDGWFKTGDVARYCAVPGAYKICGRASVDIIKSGGYKVRG